MDLIDLEKLAEREKIDIVNFKIRKKKARIVNYNKPTIFMDYSNIDSYTEEKCLLAEELGHYYYDSYYTLTSDKSFIDKQEYRANKWKCVSCVPLQSLLICFKRGITNVTDIAEELSVEPNMVEFAYNYYKDNNLLYTY